jgi:hypothetical protein
MKQVKPTIRISTKCFLLTATPDKFSVNERKGGSPDTGNLIPCSYGKVKTQIKQFYDWVAKNKATLALMTFAELHHAANKAGLKYHYYCSLD